MRHLLFVAHPFPPNAGAGAHRPLKFAKYLPSQGWAPTVLSVKPGYYVHHDQTLLRELPPEVRVVRTGSFEPRPTTVKELRGGERPRGLKQRVVRAVYEATVVPDRSVMWLPNAFAAGLRAAALHPPEVVLATGNPFSSFLLAWMLGAALRRPYVLDFQDPWTLNPYARPFARGSHPLRSRVERAQERFVLERCAAALFVSEQVRDDHVAVYPDLADRLHVIPNGYDPADFAGIRPKKLKGFSFVYAGRFTAYRRPDVFLQGLALACSRNEAFAAEARAVFVGDWGPDQAALAASLGIADRIDAPGYLPHREAIAYQKGASALALISGTDRTEQTGKVFEFLAADRPIVAPVVKGGAVEEVLLHTGGAYFCDPHDPQSIADALIGVWRDGKNARRPDKKARERYDRRALTAELAAVLERVVGAPCGARSRAAVSGRS